ncbi:unnamed protein product [Protopolystoma xenopodis]|uniref:Core-binding (CB) domain-containing protein n=1 Tax=Protopolystoma xenopodis TaxID=117903 RepID=A0A448XPF5_9PLAT|nr:unnamed protein product [Protopolystoma xenopodis]
MEIERQIMKGKGLSEKAINTLLASRKTSTSNTYYRICNVFFDWCNTHGGNFLQPASESIIEFLQQGLDKGLSLNTLKGHISALSALTSVRWASHPLVIRFIQAIKHLKPNCRDKVPPWDLPLVLKVLMSDPFEPIEEIPLSTLTLKMVLLLAIVSAKRVCELHALSISGKNLSFFADKAVFKLEDKFLPKVVSDFHLNQLVVLPTFFPNPQNEEQLSWHNLDVVRCLKCYLKRTESIRSTTALFVFPEGIRKGKKASKNILAKWIKDCINRAYSLTDKASQRL